MPSFIDLIYPRLCFHCEGPLEVDTKLFCLGCLAGLVCSQECAQKIGSCEVAFVFEPGEISFSISSKTQQYATQFLAEAMASFFFLRLTQLGWHQHQIISDNTYLQKGLQRLQDETISESVYVNVGPFLYEKEKVLTNYRRIVFLTEALA